MVIIAWMDTRSSGETESGSFESTTMSASFPGSRLRTDRVRVARRPETALDERAEYVETRAALLIEELIGGAPDERRLRNGDHTGGSIFGDPFSLEARRGQSNVGAGEGLHVALLDETRFIHTTLHAKRGHETVEGPAILPPLAQIVTINVFGLLGDGRPRGARRQESAAWDSATAEARYRRDHPGG